MRRIKTIIGRMQLSKLSRLMRLCLLFFLFNGQWSMVNGLHAEGLASIRIGGNVYGGGNAADVDGNATVTVKAGYLNKVFGGARMANIGGRTFVNIYGEAATSDIFIVEAYGGNDVAGTIGLSGEETTVPTELTEILTGAQTKETNPEKNAIDNTWKTFVRTTRSKRDNGMEQRAVIIGKLFGGGNGDFDYEQVPNGNGRVTHNIYDRDDHTTVIATKETAEGEVGFQKPEVAKTYLEINGGCIAHLYGGGNNATITENTTISIKDESDDIQTQAETYERESAGTEHPMTATQVLSYLLGMVNISTFQGNYTNWKFNFARVFGGNNKADMAIQPTWNLQEGKIRDLYSGGNQGRMTSPTGLILDIKPKADNLYPLVVENVYGGCRMADVRPLNPDGTDVNEVDNLTGYYFPRNLAARTMVQGGDIGNVYGGNDVRGKVYFGNAVGVSTSIRGDIYGGGNGAYAYTDNEEFKEDSTYGDFCYSSEGFSSSVEALNATRPDAEQVSIMVRGKDAEHPTVIGGSIYCGGNCATLETEEAHKNLKNYPLVELKIGSHVIADNVFLGNNGEGMVTEDVLKLYQSNITEGGEGGSAQMFSTMDLTDGETFKTYMEGAAMNIIPRLVFEDKDKGDRYNYENYTSKIGSFFCGGNVGSMTYAGKNTMDFSAPIYIYNKVVGGCNNASVEASTYNAYYDGGILGSKTEQESDGYLQDGKIKDRLELNFNGVRMLPQRLDDTFERVTSGTTLTKGKKYYTTNLRSSIFTADGTEVAGDVTDTYYELTKIGTKLEWNTAKWDNEEDDFMKATPEGTLDQDLRLLDGNIYGGCYNSGHVNGNVVINVNQDVLNRSEVFKTGADESNVDYEKQREDVMTLAMTLFGAGFGKDTEIWGSTTVNLNKGYVFQVFGGGEEGVVGKKDGSGEYVYNADYSSTVNLKGVKTIYSSEGTDPDIPESEYLYGGGNEGDVCGDTYVNLGNGRIYDAFGGASNANILGHTEVYIGGYGTWNTTDVGGTPTEQLTVTPHGFPWIRDNIYGGNDFGGFVKGKKNFASVTDRTSFDSKLMEAATYVRYIQGRVDSIFGGCYGEYDYTDPLFMDYTYVRGEELPEGVNVGDPKGDFHFPHLDDNSFLHFQPTNNTENKVGIIFGSSEGYPDDFSMNNAMQGESYVLIDDTETEDATQYANVDIYGGGAFAGVGSERAVGAGRTVVDLFAGTFNNVYGGSNQEGLIGSTRVNVPTASTIKLNAIYGGSKGYSPESITANTKLAARYCDTYVTCIDYQGANARVDNGIYGGNRNCRISLDTYINVGAPLYQSNGLYGTIYGAGYGDETVCGRTNIYMNAGANAYKVFGGGRDGNVFNFGSLAKWLKNQFDRANFTHDQLMENLRGYGGFMQGFRAYVAGADRISLPAPMTFTDNIWKVADNEDFVDTEEYLNTNVHLMEGSNVNGYAYGGGFGSNAVVGGRTYVELKGGNVERDIYGGGQGGHVFDEYELKSFTAETNVYIEGGMVRNVYGGGYLGHVGKHDGDISASNANDIPGIANVTIGKTNGTSFLDGIPAIMRNAYGGGEGGSVYGTANITLNNGYIGYRYKNTGSEESPVYKYVEELDDQRPNSIELAGNLFGGGYVVNSYVDNANVEMYGGTIRGSLYGGGEIGPIGRGTMKAGATIASGGIKNGPNDEATIYKAGKTHVKMFNGHVLRNVFGGGRGKDSWGGDGTMYMDEAIKPTLDLKCKGYVFGQTEVDIYGGEIGTDEGMARNFGNVFGGGDEGSVYSAYENGDGTLCIGKKDGVRYDGLYQGYYFKNENGAFTTIQVENGTYTAEEIAAAEEGDDAYGKTPGQKKYTTERQFTEDCKVLVEPWLQVKNSNIEYDSKTYKVGDYVPTDYLNTLKAKSGDNWPAGWENVDVGTIEKERGINIHNAVFAGGNIASGSSDMYANAKTVFGNATTTIHDVYNRDLITIGTGHTGGLYGDGNLTFVDGYRELNITNYGTDKYHLVSPLTIEQYRQLPGREQAYYEPKYECVKSCTDNAGTTYSVTSSLPYDELTVLFLDENGQSLKDGTTAILDWNNTTKKWIPNPTYWAEKGVVSTYAGRIMNTIQRADFCGVFGSRMVMKGAQDRVPEEVDYTNYTINRVREVSLNKMNSTAGDTGADDKMHGNYFGIYSIVNYLGALTSDVDFQSVRTTNRDEDDLKADGVTTFEGWKELHKTDRKRNNGSCHNQVALASGVYLELTTEESTGNKLNEKVWGPITGVVELDLINVQPGIGGGFVYAKNEHGVRSNSGIKTTTLTALNENAVTKWDFNYATPDADRKEWETSGNFIHSSQTIIDDCYNISNRYLSTNFVPAHYWYVSGSVYVYDQYISAYTGSPNAYSETVELPITINAASNGSMTLMDVQPNLYAYYSSYTDANTNTPLSGEQKLVINDVTYQLNDPISYWEWNKLPAAEKKLFVKDTYVVSEDCKVGETAYTAGTVLLKSQYDALFVNNLPPTNVTHKRLVNDVEQDVEVAFNEVFHSSNNMSHNTGYLLTYNVTNPNIWNQWYTNVSSSTREKNQTGGAGYENGPTYHPTETGLYGQQEYSRNDIISQTTYYKYEGYDKDENGVYTDEGDIKGLKQMYNAITSRTDQATFVPAYLLTKEYTSESAHYYPGAPVSAEISGYTTPAYISTATIQLSATDYIYVNDLMTEADIAAYKTRYPESVAEINDLIVPAYICTVDGLYGGSYYETSKNYRALEAYSSMSPADRENFTFNYDALDLLIDPTYGGTTGKKYQYDSAAGTLEGANNNDAHYSLTKPIDYTATYNSTTDLDMGEGKEIEVTRYNSTEEKYEKTSVQLVKKDDELTREVYEQLPNEQRHYAPITVKSEEVASGSHTVYVVRESFVHVETPYAAGATIEGDAYSKLSTEEQKYITSLTFTEAGTYFYCREAYTINEHGEGKAVKAIMANDKGLNSNGETVSITANQTISSGEVPIGFIIAQGAADNEAYSYRNLPNKQKNFTIHGESPMETSTLFVSRNANIKDLSTEKVITVIYKYDYEESDASGLHITPVSERHVVNIHINFKSGVPTVEDIREPNIVLPGTSITMRVPTVTPGAYEVLGGGWELFEDPSDAESHINGVPYTPSVDSLYWYQDGFYLAYYAKTYLGKTYSNHVPISVANYHDLKKVMDDKKYHLHVDYDRTRLKRDSKVYINNYSGTEDGLDYLRDFYDLSLISATGGGYTVADNKITGATGSANAHLVDHTLLNNSTDTGTNKYYPDETNTKGVKAGTNLQFILRTDINHTGSWTPIGSIDDEATPSVDESQCFKGDLHGDGHTISGLDNSLFENLCGSVYNLGVTGSFTSAGVVNEGTGYVESSWIKTTGTPDGTKYAVFGDPKDTKGKQVVNCYYPEDKAYKTTTHERGNAKAMPEKAFYNGELAYNLNNFYLYKRYCDEKVNEGYKYYFYKKDGAGLSDLQTGFYAQNADLCSSGYIDNTSNGIQYVEDRFEDGDFRYASGSITLAEDERCYIDTEDNDRKYWFPIWPDDYLFFGQALNYGYVEGLTHQNVPTAINRNNGRVDDTESGNRVYRAPAYYGSKTMGSAYFNKNAVFAQSKNGDATTIAYKGMTAIDFSGSNGDVAGGYEKGYQDTKFFPPLLDDDGLTSFKNVNLTRNLLVYTPAAGTTMATTSKYLTEYVYDNIESNKDSYRNIEWQDPAYIHGHWIQQAGSEFAASKDHMLVDLNDFNAPMAYDFTSNKRMFYQRLPEDNEFVNLSAGWQGISIPFTAELVTTSDKGEITHFYDGSETSKNETGSKIGHEYWLRQYRDISEVSGEDAIRTARFTYPTKNDGNVMQKTTQYSAAVTNTFLWDYYYNGSHGQVDYHNDSYPGIYYSKKREYTDYPMLTAATPYLIGLPGKIYHEFDLSGKFEASTTAIPTPEKLAKQTITFVSQKNTSIGISDDELVAVTHNGYSFKPSYATQTIAANANAYTLSTTGASYDKVSTTVETTVQPFRPYFAAVVSPTKEYKYETRSIRFSNDGIGDLNPDDDMGGDNDTNGLEIYSKGRKIYTVSHLKENVNITIVNASGATMTTYVLEPDKKVITPINTPGTYIVNKKKLYIK